MLVGVLGQGENVSNEDAQDGLKTLNEIVDKWNIESLMIMANKDITFNCTGKKMYTIGTGGDINVLRPPSGVMDAYYLMPTSSYETSLPISLITQGEYNAIALKDLYVNPPERLFYSPTWALGDIYVYPIATVGKIVLTVSDQFLAFDSLDSIVDLPSGYAKALRYNLAVELGLEYGHPASQDVKEMAVGAKAFIKTTNGSQRRETLCVDSALRMGASGAPGNIYNGFSGS